MTAARKAAPPDRVLRLAYEPRPDQARIHAQLKRFSAVVCHRRFGKTTLGVNALIDAALRCRKPSPRFAYVAPFLTQAKDIAWAALQRFGGDIPGSQRNEAELYMRWDRDGTGEDKREEWPRVRLYGADHPDRLRGLGLDGVVFDECADLDPRIWAEIVRPALADRQGWALFIGTSKGMEFFHDIYVRATTDPAWFAALLPVSVTKIIPESELALIRADMTPEEYAQEFECDFAAAPAGTYYAREMAALAESGRIGRLEYDPAAMVYTGWDLGHHDDTAIWFAQLVGPDVHIIDYYEASGAALPHYVKVLRDRPYVYAPQAAIVPHDAGVHDLGTGKSRIETLAALGVRVKVLDRSEIEDGIHAVRMMLPRCRFDAEKCAAGIDHLRKYRREWNQKMDRFQASPRHDKHSHGSDALRYLSLGLPLREPGPKPRGHARTNSAYAPLAWRG